MAQTVWIARHGNRLDFVYPDWFNTAQRRYDPPLSEDGFLQAQALGQRLQKEAIAHIFASPFLRTVQTAHAVAECLNLPIKLESGLSEWLNPHWMTEMPERLLPEVLAQQYPRLDLSYTSCVIPQYPETENEVMERSAVTVHQLVQKYSEDILLVGHAASVVGTTQGLVGGQPFVNTALCCLVKVVHKNGNWEMELNGDTTHLAPQSASFWA
ncbi:histidine phosphatase family protein [Spirulina subsalsa FACHB-351]|uniref:Histidine phosphatase family protein n=1 Tax=Spirulina subsalsa FACHB-351 TaxID=234711 RepID=A0ABT3L5D3_9CYAN|nr:histidine phosphatase family protein [Spirulina subsalsa]MCW6036309.1 histidine phosphatase family protein [Spirulina subsalsa FACHB-351]